MIQARRFGGACRALAALGVVIALAAPSRAAAAEVFSFFGVRFGMTAAEVNTHWNRLGEGAYSVPALGIQEVQAAFNHEGRIYEITFSLVPPESKVPPEIQMRAIQQAVESRWGAGNPALGISFSTSRKSTQIRVTDKKLLDGYVTSVQETIGALLKP